MSNGSLFINLLLMRINNVLIDLVVWETEPRNVVTSEVYIISLFRFYIAIRNGVVTNHQRNHYIILIRFTMFSDRLTLQPRFLKFRYSSGHSVIRAIITNIICGFVNNIIVLFGYIISNSFSFLLHDVMAISCAVMPLHGER